MATLYAENVPDELYEGLRKRAQQNRKSIAAEIISLLELHIPSEETLKKRRRAARELERLGNTVVSPGTGTVQSAEEMIREDRER